MWKNRDQFEKDFLHIYIIISAISLLVLVVKIFIFAAPVYFIIMVVVVFVVVFIIALVFVNKPLQEQMQKWWVLQVEWLIRELELAYSQHALIIYAAVLVPLKCAG